MASPTTTRTRPGAERPPYRERLRVPWWWWLGGLAIAALAASEVGLGAAGPRGWLPYVILLPLAGAGLYALDRLRVTVTSDELLVDDARLPLAVVADAIPIDANGRRELMGPSADPLAFMIVRPWISQAVQVVLNDPDDPTPYWVISSRKPLELAAAINAARR